MSSNSSYDLQPAPSELTENSGIASSPPPSYERALSEGQAVEISVGEEEEKEEKKQSEEIQERVQRPRPQIIHKSSKELYKAVAAQWGITCKMSDHCRCLDCQGHYLDCDYDLEEQEKTDGGLGAGTPMFLSEVMHGSACIIL